MISLGAINAEVIKALEQKYLAPTYRRAPMVFESGDGVWLQDSEGRRYLDCLAGIATNALGYGDPDVLKALREVPGNLIHVTNLYHTASHVFLARDLCEASFADRVFFCNSGTEATEGALKFARKWARFTDAPASKHEVVAFTNSFHGRSMGALAVTGNEKYRLPFEPLMSGVRWAEFNDLESARAVVGEATAAVIVEPVQGEGGIVPATTEFLTGLRSLCDQAGAALIFDEVQCGLGRTGTLWAHEAAGVTPDIMTLAKPLGGGLPIGAILMTERIAQALAPGDHGSTFAGGPYLTRVASVVFNKVRRADFLAHVREVGRTLEDGLRGLAKKHEVVTEVRGRGLMWGLQVAPEVTMDAFIAAGYAEGLIMGSAGGNTVRLVPPLIIEAEHVERLIAGLDRILAGVK